MIALDERVSKAIAKGLRMWGIDVTISSEEGLIGASDEEQLAYALLQGRVFSLLMMAIADASTRCANISNIIGAFALWKISY